MSEPRKMPICFLDTSSHWKPSWSRILFLLRPEGRFLSNYNVWDIEAVHYFHHGKPRIFQMQMHAIWAVQCPSHISEINAELPRGTKLDILLNLFGQHDSLLKDWGGTLAALACCVWSLLWTQPEAKTHFMQILLGWDQPFGSSHLMRGHVAQQRELALDKFTLSWNYMEIQAFLDLVGHYQQFIKGFAYIMQPFHKHLSGEGASTASK